MYYVCNDECSLSQQLHLVGTYLGKNLPCLLALSYLAYKRIVMYLSMDALVLLASQQ